MRLPWLTLIALALATPAAAQMAYRYVFPDGRVVYSDQPVPGAHGERAIAPPPPSADPVPGAAAPTATAAPAVTAAPAEPTAAPETSPKSVAAAAPAEAVPGARWQPPPGATEPVGLQSVAAEPVATQPAAAQPVALAVPAQTASPGADRVATLAAATEEVHAAERNLAAAQASLAAGREPLPGERTGLAHGGSRLNEAYKDRQRGLEAVVADAQTRLDRAIADRNAARF